MYSSNWMLQDGCSYGPPPPQIQAYWPNFDDFCSGSEQYDLNFDEFYNHDPYQQPQQQHYQPQQQYQRPPPYHPQQQGCQPDPVNEAFRSNFMCFQPRSAPPPMCGPNAWYDGTYSVGMGGGVRGVSTMMEDDENYLNSTRSCGDCASCAADIACSRGANGRGVSRVGCQAGWELPGGDDAIQQQYHLQQQHHQQQPYVGRDGYCPDFQVYPCQQRHQLLQQQQHLLPLPPMHHHMQQSILPDI